MNNDLWRDYIFNKKFEDDYGYVFLDEKELVKPDQENIDITNSIIKIRQENALQILYNCLDINEKKKLIELILNDTNLL